MKINPNRFRVKQGTKVNLLRWPTRVQPYFESKADQKRLLKKQVEELSELQSRLYAHDRYSVLLIFQAMDAAGKDSAIKHVMSGVNPQGCQVFSFKHPSAEELDHDFLWRTTRSLPERGRIGIFNRSYYEEVLIVRVHPEILKSQRLPEPLMNPKTVWQDRYRSIVDLESHLHRNGTQVVKFFLHISREEQRQRLLKRIEEPDKNWKVNPMDIEERGRWEEYMRAYEGCISATSTRTAPWYIVPADDKANARLIIAQAVLDTLTGLKPEFPEPDAKRREQLRAIRQLLAKPG
jgi:PPK2 family polyphosphate:nucleotide phosphotransferase